jgi:Fic family protein
MKTYIHQLANWPKFNWKQEKLSKLLSNVHRRQGKLMGRMEGLGFALRSEAVLKTLTLDVLKSSEIEGEVLDSDQVCSSIARRLGMEIAGLIQSDRNVDGVVEMMLDATQQYQKLLSNERLFSWQASLFPTGRSGMFKITVGTWRISNEPMQVVSGAIGREKVHFEAPEANLVATEMNKFIEWFNSDLDIDPILKAAIAHLWFVTIHPFDDGNGRIARALTDMQLARVDGSSQRFYSMSAQIRLQRNAYYDLLEKTQKGNLDITEWLEWFLSCLVNALETTEETLSTVLRKAMFWEKYRFIGLNERQRLMLNKLLDGFDGKLNTSKWAKITKCSSDTALRDIQNLIDNGILMKEDAGGRSTSYIFTDISK